MDRDSTLGQLTGEAAIHIINELSELVYLVNPETYDLIYINPAGRRQFGFQDWHGGKCHQLLYGEDKPCQFCNNRNLNYAASLCWNHYNHLVDRHYQLKDKLVNLYGKPMKLEIACDVTDLEKQRLVLEESLRVESLLNRCARDLSNLEEPEQALSHTLQRLGEFLRCDRVYVFRIEGDRMNNSHEWCAPGVESQLAFCQGIPLYLIDRWRPSFDREESIVIRDIEAIRLESPEEYQVLAHQNIRSLIASPLTVNHRLVGYIGVDNYRMEVEGNIPWLLSSLSHFVSAMLHHAMLLDTDLLTRMYSRNRFIRDLSKHIPFPVGVVYVDVNGMKQMNDQFGHSYGDSILQEVASLIKEAFPTSSCYRVGGDEFAIISHSTQEADFELQVQTLKNSFCRAGQFDASVGSRWSLRPVDLGELLQSADHLMYTDKKSYYRGKPSTKRYRGYLDQIRQLSNPDVLKEEIESGCFVVYYQPKFHAISKELTGSEALVRYGGTDGQRFPPNQFIPYLEELGLISMLDYHIFCQVCAQQKEWMDSGMRPVPIAVNFSRHTLEKEGFVDRINDIRLQHGIPQQLIEIEVTETIEADNTQLFYRTITKLQQKGFRIAIDDFGSRHANLNMLIDMDFDVLKIDMHVIQLLCQDSGRKEDIEQAGKCRLLVETVAKCCSRLGIHTVAEGVETPAQLEIIKDIGCDEVQGYLFSRPVHANQFCRDFLTSPQHPYSQSYHVPS